MEVTYEHKEAMRFIGFSRHIHPAEGYRECPRFWEEAYETRYARLWQGMAPGTADERAVLSNEIGRFALCLMDEDGGFSYVIAGLYRGGEVPEGMALYDLPESDYAVFTARGPMPDSLQRLNDAVWSQWYPTEGQQFVPNGLATLEVYSPGDPQAPDYPFGIWVPIRRRG